MRAFIKWVRETISLWADVEQLTGPWGGAVAVGYGIAVGVIGSMTNISWFWVLVGTPIAGIALLFLWQKFIEFRKPKPNFRADDWANHPIYSVWVAACLWANHRPWPHIPVDSPAWPTLQMIKTHIESGQIKTLPDSKPGMKARISKEELVKLATIRNEKPKFLFP